MENYLHDQVCSGAMALADAQSAVQSDWVAVFQSMPSERQTTAVEGDPIVSYPPDATGAPAGAQPSRPSAVPTLAPAAPAPAAPTDGHMYYASTYRTARTICCDSDPEWRSLSKNYLASYPSLAAAQAALPGYVLHRAC